MGDSTNKPIKPDVLHVGFLPRPILPSEIPKGLTPQQEEDFRRREERRRRESAWRLALQDMSKEEIIEVVVSGGWEITALWTRIQSLREKYLVHRRGRAKGGRNKHAKVTDAKIAAKEVWDSEEWRAKRNQRGALKEFSELIADKGAVDRSLEPETVAGWTREWRRNEKGKEAPTQSAKFRPEIFNLMKYFRPEDLA